ncbi:lysosomal alpha-mannosidase-like [Pectinophora gossypiella]|uniref:lysosomal alpha-mannosidase-like n=1 Tax=Pectinophora gossypiella TaxID=13191 RepID=UPI00214DF836|nr:lysosomal alpha-mannosidase-like [Pectinophora gossypiella]
MLGLLVLILSAKCVVCDISPEIVDLLTPLKQLGEACGYDSCQAPMPKALNVHVVAHTHYELGMFRHFHESYSGTDHLGLKTPINMKKTLDAVITELWTSPYRKFTFSDIPFFFQWWSQRDNTVRRMVYQLLRQGRLTFVGGSWGMVDEATTSYHAIIESYTFALRKLNSTFLSCGRPLVSFQADVMGHSREYASLAAQMGFDGLFINPICFDDELARMKRKALEFYWRGSDDLGPQSDIFTHKLFDGYWSPPGFCFDNHCSDPLIITSDAAVFANAEERAKQFINSMWKRQASNYNTSNVLVVMGKQNGWYDAPRWFINIDKLIDEVNRLSAVGDRRINMMYSSPACYLKAVHEANPPLENKQDDFLPFAYDDKNLLNGFYTTNPALKLIAREGLVYLQMSKQLQVLAKLFKNDKLFEEFNWIVAAMQDHTVITGAMADHVKGYYMHKMYVNVQKSTLLLKQAFNKLRKSPTGTIYYRCSFNISRCHYDRGTFSFVMIYNPLTWSASVPVRLPVHVGDYRVFKPNGDLVNVSMMKIADAILNIKYRSSSSEHELVFVAENIPPLGYRSYFVERFGVPESTRMKRTLIKNLKRKNNKKYLIRQTSPITDEQTFLNELEDYDYSDDNITDMSKIFDDITTTTVRFDNPTEFEDITAIPDTERPDDYTNKANEKYDKHKTLNNTDNFTENNFVILDKHRKKIWLEYRNATKGGTLKGVDTTPMSVSTTERDTEPTELNDPSNYPESTHSAPSTTTNFEKEGSGELVEVDIAPDTRRFQEEARVEEEEDDDDDTTTAKPQTKKPTRKPPATKSLPTAVPTRSTVKTTTKRPEKTSETTTVKTTTAKARRKSSKYDKIKDHIYEELVTKEAFDTYASATADFIENKYIRIKLDPQSRKIKEVVLSNGIHVNLEMQLLFYVSDDPDRLQKNMRSPGTHIFRAMDNTPIPIMDYFDVQTYKSVVVEEVHITLAEWASIAVRLYADSPVIEVDWLVGPVPVDDRLGKEIFMRYTTDLVNEGIFYTDSNGRQTIKRIRNMRPMFESQNNDPVAGNFYPVTSKIYIEDTAKNLRFSVFNDRAQGGSSLYDGEIDLMVQRRLLTSDLGVGITANETEEGEGVIIRGKHYLYISRADFKPHKIFEKKFAKELELGPQILVSQPDPYWKETKEIWYESVNEMSFLKRKLPIGIHLLTLEQLPEDKLLLRLENFLEKADIKKNGVKIVNVKDMFTNIVIKEMRETTLGGNMWLKDYMPLPWKKKELFVRNFNEFYGTRRKVERVEDEFLDTFEEVNLDNGIALTPQQIRTFVCLYEYVNV